MADIFVSYSRQDRKRVAPLVQLFQEQGWTVWWDSEINPGQSFEELIDEELGRARAVVVVWSKHAITSRWVRNEALEAADREILFPVRLDNSRIPVAFRQTQAADLTRWPGGADGDELEQLLRALALKLGGRPQHTTPKNTSQRRARRLRLGVSAAVACAAIAIGGLAWQKLFPEPDRNARQSIALLQMETKSISEAAAFAADSLGDEISQVLENVNGLRLAHITSAWEVPYELTADEKAERLGVRYLLQGKATEQAGGVTVQIRVYDSLEEINLLDDSFEFRLSEIQLLRRQIAQAVLGAIGYDRSRIDMAMNASAASRDNDAYQRYLRAKAILRRSGEMDELAAARDLLRQATQQDPAFGAAHSALCRANLGIFRVGGATQNFEQAERACHRALTVGGGGAEALLALGDLYELSGQYERAEDAYERALDLDPLLTDALSGLGYVLTMRGEVRRAERAYRRSTDIQPGYWRTHNRLGWFYLQQGRYQEAIDAYTQVIFLAPKNPWGFSNRGSARFGAGDFSEAIEDWRQAGDIDPESGSLSNMGTAYFYLREFAEAVSMYRMALDNSPTNYQIWINLGDALRYHVSEDAADEDGESSRTSASGAYRQAVRHIRDELTVNPNNALAVSAEARVQAFFGERARAEQLLGRALQAPDNNPDLYYNVSLAYLSLEMIEQAANSLSKALDVGLPLIVAQNDPLFDLLRESNALGGRLISQLGD